MKFTFSRMPRGEREESGETPEEKVRSAIDAIEDEQKREKAEKAVNVAGNIFTAVNHISGLLSRLALVFAGLLFAAVGGYVVFIALNSESGRIVEGEYVPVGIVGITFVGFGLYAVASGFGFSFRRLKRKDNSKVKYTNVNILSLGLGIVFALAGLLPVGIGVIVFLNYILPQPFSGWIIPESIWQAMLISGILLIFGGAFIVAGVKCIKGGLVSREHSEAFRRKLKESGRAIPARITGIESEFIANVNGQAIYGHRAICMSEDSGREYLSSAVKNDLDTYIGRCVTVYLDPDDLSEDGKFFVDLEQLSEAGCNDAVILR